MKTKEAYEKIKKNVIVEDWWLCINWLNGLPGPYIKDFYNALGNEGIYKMIENFKDKSCIALCIIGYLTDGLNWPILFKGELKGKIVKPRGNNGFGWDWIFEPDGYNKTLGEMSEEEKNKIWQRTKAIQQMKNYFSNKTEKIINKYDNVDAKLRNYTSIINEKNEEPIIFFNEIKGKIKKWKNNTDNYENIFYPEELNFKKWISELSNNEKQNILKKKETINKIINYFSNK